VSKTKTTYLVELCNNADSRDNEAASIRAVGVHAAAVAVEQRVGTSKWTVGRIVKARGNKRKVQREIAAELRSILTQRF